MDISRTLFFCCLMLAGLVAGAVIGWQLPPFHLSLETISPDTKPVKRDEVPIKSDSEDLSETTISTYEVGKNEVRADISPVESDFEEPLEQALEDTDTDLMSGDVAEEQKFTPRIETAGLPAHNFPKRFLRPPRSVVQKRALTKLVRFETSPFPYDGVMPHNGEPFLNHEEDGRKAHKTRSGRIYYQDETYNEERVLLHIPKGFDIEKPAYMVLFFHGHGATLERDIINRQRVPQQLSRAGVNAVLVAPQFAKNARDSSAGKFWQPGGARKFVQEAERKLGELYGVPGLAGRFKNMPIFIVGYSGGFLPTAWTLARGGISKRVKGVALMDGLYGHQKTFSRWISRHRDAIFVSAYTGLTARRNVSLEEGLTSDGIGVVKEFEGSFEPGTVAIVRSDEDHHSYITKAWTSMPIRDLLKRSDAVLREN